MYEEMGGAETILNWTAADAWRWKPRLIKRCQAVAETQNKDVLADGKYGFMVELMPTMASPRPFILISEVRPRKA